MTCLIAAGRFEYYQYQLFPAISSDATCETAQPRGGHPHTALDLHQVISGLSFTTFLNVGPSRILWGHSGVDSRFSLWGSGLLCGHILAKVYAKTNELGPVGVGGCGEGRKGQQAPRSVQFRTLDVGYLGISKPMWVHHCLHSFVV